MKSNSFRRGKTVFALFTIASMVFSLVSYTPQASAALTGGAVGPVAPAGGLFAGFPLWYQDQNGLALELMEAADPFGLSAAPTPGFGQTVGFGAEGFYWAAEAFPNNGVQTGLLVLALEAAFAGETAVDGEQSVFSRVRYRVTGLTPGETYTVNHPFGSVQEIADAAGVINTTSDIGCFALGTGLSSCNPNTPPGNPNNFSLALQGGIGPFLTWTTFNAATTVDPLLINPANPTKKYIGNPGIEHAVTGGTNGNSFSVTGPGIVTPLSTDLFTVMGRVAVLDTVAPVITTVPTTAALGATNVVLTANVTDNLGVKPLVSAVKMDLGPLGNDFSASMNGAQEVGTLGSSANGSGTFTIDTAANTLSFNITFSGLPAGDIETTPHIHNAALGANGPVVFDLPAGASKVGVWNYPENLEAEILAGRTYVQIHSVLFPSGAIRGQILPTTNIQNMILTAGTATNGTWSIIVPSTNKLGLFTLPITATDGSNIANGSLSLSVSALSSVTLTPASATIIGTSTQQLTASPLDNNGAATAATVTFTSSNPAVASVNATSGLVTAVTPGSAVITASAVSGATTVTATSSITVLSALPVLTSAGVTPASAGITVAADAQAGSTLQLTAAPKDQFGTPIVGAVTTWSSNNPAVATVNATSGLVTSVATGTATITASVTAGAVTVTGTSVITVATGPTVTTINVTPATSTIGVATTKQLAATTIDQNGAPIVATLTWTSSNPAVASVNATSGLVTAVAPGVATISGTSGAISGTSVITVVAPVLTSINITPATAVAVGGVQQLTAAGVDQLGAAMALTGTTTWSSSNTAVGTVNTAGVFTAVAPGATVITAVNGAATGTVTMNVNAVPVAGGGGGGGGGGGSVSPLPTSVSAMNVPLTVANSQTGSMVTNFAGGAKVQVNVPQGAVGQTTTFTTNFTALDPAMAPERSGEVNMVGSNVFNITANVAKTFAKPISISLTLPDLKVSPSAISVYYFDVATKKWVRIPSAVYDSARNAFTFEVDHLTTFALIQGAKPVIDVKADNSGRGNGQVLGVRIFAEGTMIRAKNGKIFIITNNQKRHIVNLIELRKHHAGKKFIAVDDATLQKITDFVGKTLNIDLFANGTLIRTTDHKIFAINKGTRQPVSSLAELRRDHRGKKINNISDDELKSIPLVR